MAYTHRTWRFAIATKTSTQSAQRIDEARQFAIDAARLAADTRCHDVAVLDVRGISPVTDYFIIATGTSARQMRTVAEQVEELGAPRRFAPLSRSGYEGDNWILTDFVNVVLHIFAPEARSYYDLDGLWGDAPRVEWHQDSPPSSP